MRGKQAVLQCCEGNVSGEWNGVYYECYSVCSIFLLMRVLMLVALLSFSIWPQSHTFQQRNTVLKAFN